jgi:hypothetical protein
LILEKEVCVHVNNHNIEHYESLGYKVTRYVDKKGKLKIKNGVILLVNSDDISKGSNVRVTKICDMLDCNNTSENVPFRDLVNSRKKTDGNDRCGKCGEIYRAFSKKDNVKYEKSLEHHAIHNDKKFLIVEYSSKNKRSVDKVSKGDNEKYIWECSKCKREYNMSINNRINNHGCGCGFSRGEDRIYEWLSKNNIDNVKYKSYFTLEGLSGGSLNYDFYIPSCNLLIEYQGEQHVRPVDFDGIGIQKATVQFKKQQEHDRRKKEYAIKNNISLLEIWFWDYENIEKILENILNVSVINEIPSL